MGRDAGGHGHDPGESGNPNHGAHGYFSDGGGDGGSGGGRKQAWSKPTVTLDKKATAERQRVERAKQMKEDAKRKEAKTEDKAFDKKQTATYREAKAEDRARDRAAAKGDHQRAQSANAGHGHPVAMHAGQKSVGTHSSGGGGSGGAATGGGGGDGRGIGIPKGSPKLTKTTKGLRQSAKEGVAIGQSIDQRHFPSGQMTQPIVSGYRSGRH
jgi:hypothetical protein